MSNPIELLIKLGVDDAPTKANINEYIKKLKVNQVDVELNVKGNTSKFEKEAERTGGRIKTAIEDSFNVDLSKVKTDVDNTFKNFYSNANELRQDLERKGFRVKMDTNEATKEIDRITASIKNANNELTKVTFTPSIGNDGNSYGFEARKSSQDFASAEKLSDAYHKTTMRLKDLEHQGILSEKAMHKLNLQLAKDSQGNWQGDVSSLKQINREMDQLVQSATHQYDIEKGTNKLLNRQREMIAQIVRIEKSNPRMSDALKNQADILKSGISNVKSSGFVDVKQIESANEALNSLRGQVQRLGADSTMAMRNSMSVVDAFKVAMERFPIWMAASTAFYGTVRSIRDAMQQIVQLDSQMTVLRRVGGDAVDVNKTLEESVRLAQKLGNEIADINEGFIAFARQGYKGEELTQMAEYATLLGNISDMNVEESASVLTAALKGFGLEAEKAIHVVDSLNEVDNNYAITTQQLAESLQRAAGASYTYGVSLEKTIGYTTAIGQVTRESGSVIGKLTVAV